MADEKPSEPALIARYKENADQARHHETLRERSTTMVLQTTGVVLGLLGLKGGVVQAGHATIILALFVVLLGLWGIFSSLVFESRARRHRNRIDRLLKQLIPGFSTKPKTHELNWVWLLLHSGVVVLGVAMLCLAK